MSRIRKQLNTAVFLDGFLWVMLSVFVTIQTIFTSEEAYKYVNPYTLFWIKSVTGVMAAATGSLKAFRSTSYSRSITNETNEKDNPPTVTKPDASNL